MTNFEKRRDRDPAPSIDPELSEEPFANIQIEVEKTSDESLDFKRVSVEGDERHEHYMVKEARKQDPSTNDPADGTLYNLIVDGRMVADNGGKPFTGERSTLDLEELSELWVDSETPFAVMTTDHAHTTNSFREFLAVSTVASALLLALFAMLFIQGGISSSVAGVLLVILTVTTIAFGRTWLKLK